MKTAELGLVVAACKAAFDRDAPLALPASADWDSILHLARFHRVQGLMWQSLGPLSDSIPPQIGDALTEDARAIAAANLRTAVESRDLLAAFEDAGIAVLFVKGLTLGALAYGTSSFKSGIDIDILVLERDLQRSAGLLSTLGYRPADVTGHDVKEQTWLHSSNRIQVDLHTRLADNRRLIPGIGLASPRQIVEVAPKILLPTLGPDELFAYLCVHGASSLWFRLKWITDFAALIHGKDGAEIERLYRCSQALGAGRASAQALLLADALYGSLAPCRSLRDELSRERTNRLLLNQALKQIARSFEPTSRLFGTLRIHLVQFGLLPGIGFKLEELVRQARAALP